MGRNWSHRKIISCIYCVKYPIYGHIKYIGRTKDFKIRKRQHEKGEGKIQISEWERGIISLGLKPIVEVLIELPDNVMTYQMCRAEAKQIIKHIKQGHPLLNVQRFEHSYMYSY